MPEKKLVPFQVLVRNTNTQSLARQAAEGLRFQEGFYTHTYKDAKSQAWSTLVYKSGPRPEIPIEEFVRASKPQIVVREINNVEGIRDVYEVDVDPLIERPLVRVLRETMRDLNAGVA
jgi:hypothetical protein